MVGSGPTRLSQLRLTLRVKGTYAHGALTSPPEKFKVLDIQQAIVASLRDVPENLS
jgi:hypothetical protein